MGNFCLATAGIFYPHAVISGRQIRNFKSWYRTSHRSDTGTTPADLVRPCTAGNFSPDHVVVATTILCQESIDLNTRLRTTQRNLNRFPAAIGIFQGNRIITRRGVQNVIAVSSYIRGTIHRPRPGNVKWTGFAGTHPDRTGFTAIPLGSRGTYAQCRF